MNRAASDSLAAASARLGDAGVALRKDLIRACGSMESAEGDLRQDRRQTGRRRSVGGARAARQVATPSWPARSRPCSSSSAPNCRVATHRRADRDARDPDVDPRDDRGPGPPRRAEVADGADRWWPGCRSRRPSWATRTEQLLALAEETEFGIALPTRVRVLGREMRTVQGWLEDGDVSTGRSRWKCGSRKTCSGCSRRCAGSRPGPRRHRARPPGGPEGPRGAN